MIWKPRDDRTFVYLKYRDTKCVSIRSGTLYDNDYEQESARRAGYLIAPQEFARWMD